MALVENLSGDGFALKEEIVGASGLVLSLAVLQREGEGFLSGLGFAPAEFIVNGIPESLEEELEPGMVWLARCAVIKGRRRRSH